MDILSGSRVKATPTVFGVLPLWIPPSNKNLFRACAIFWRVIPPVCDVKAESMTIPEMLRITHQAHEQQQAQQLRCRLNEQIDAPTFTPSYKKYNNKPQ